jgi:hypothetical protein
LKKLFIAWKQAPLIMRPSPQENVILPELRNGFLVKGEYQNLSMLIHIGGNHEIFKNSYYDDSLTDGELS